MKSIIVAADGSLLLNFPLFSEEATIVHADADGIPIQGLALDPNGIQFPVQALSSDGFSMRVAWLIGGMWFMRQYEGTLPIDGSDCFMMPIPIDYNTDTLETIESAIIEWTQADVTITSIQAEVIAIVDTVVDACFSFVGVGSHTSPAQVLSLYPNPASQGESMRFQTGNAAHYDYMVMDVMGRQLSQGVSQDGGTLRTEGFSAGTYLLHALERIRYRNGPVRDQIELNSPAPSTRRDRLCGRGGCHPGSCRCGC